MKLNVHLSLYGEKKIRKDECEYLFFFTSLTHGLCNPFRKTKFWFLFHVQVFGLQVFMCWTKHPYK